MKNSIKILKLLFILNSPLIGHAQTLEAPPLWITEGEQRFLSIGPIQKFSIGAPFLTAKSISSEPSPGLLIKGLKAGRTDLWVWKSDHTVEHRTVQVKKPHKLNPNSESFEQMIGELQEVEVSTSGVNSKGESLYILRGEIHSTREASRIRAILNAHTDRIQNETLPAMPLFQKGLSYLKAWVAKSEFKNKIKIESSSILRNITLVGNLSDQKQAALVLQSAQTQYPLIQSQILALSDTKPIIHFKIYLLELRKSKMRGFGLESPTHIESLLKINSQFLKPGFDFQSTLRNLEKNGEARVLSKPEITVRSPGEAELFAGGEMPIELRTPSRMQVEWKKIGLGLKLKVLESTQSKVRVDISTEVSGLDPSLASDHIQGIQSSQLKTQVDADFNQPLFLCGLIQKNSLHSAQGFQWMRRLPVLGSLFGSKDFQKNRTELVAVLIPQISQAIKVETNADNPWQYFGD